MKKLVNQWLHHLPFEALGKLLVFKVSNRNINIKNPSAFSFVSNISRDNCELVVSDFDVLHTLVKEASKYIRN